MRAIRGTCESHGNACLISASDGMEMANFRGALLFREQKGIYIYISRNVSRLEYEIG